MPRPRSIKRQAEDAEQQIHIGIVHSWSKKNEELAKEGWEVLQDASKAFVEEKAKERNTRNAYILSKAEKEMDSAFAYLEDRVKHGGGDGLLLEHEQKPRLELAKLPDDKKGEYKDQRITIDPRKMKEGTIFREMYHFWQGIVLPLSLYEAPDLADAPPQLWRMKKLHRNTSGNPDFVEAGAAFAEADYLYFSGRMGNVNYLDEPVSEKTKLKLSVISRMIPENTDPELQDRYPELQNQKLYYNIEMRPETFLNILADRIDSVFRHADKDIAAFYNAIVEDIMSEIQANRSGDKSLGRMTAIPNPGRLAANFIADMADEHLSFAIAALAFASTGFDIDRTYAVLESAPEEVLRAIAGTNQERVAEVKGIIGRILLSTGYEADDLSSETPGGSTYLLRKALENAPEGLDAGGCVMLSTPKGTKKGQKTPSAAENEELALEDMGLLEALKKMDADFDAELQEAGTPSKCDSLHADGARPVQAKMMLDDPLLKEWQDMDEDLKPQAIGEQELTDAHLANEALLRPHDVLDMQVKMGEPALANEEAMDLQGQDLNELLRAFDLMGDGSEMPLETIPPTVADDASERQSEKLTNLTQNKRTSDSHQQ